MIGISVSAYGSIAKPNYYKKFIKSGDEYLREGKSQEAILEFNKAFKLEPKSTTARVGTAKGYVGTDDFEEAIRVLCDARDIAPKDETLILQIINILKDVDLQVAYEMFQQYLSNIGEENASDVIKELLETSLEEPTIPGPEPVPDTYIKPVMIKFLSDKVRLGHTVHYTIDGSEPSKDSKVYNKPISVSEGSTTIKLVVINPQGSSTAPAEYTYQIKGEPKIVLDNVIKEAQDNYDNIKVGTDVGNCIPDAKEQLKAAIDRGTQTLQSPFIKLIEAQELLKYLKDELNNFKLKIIVPTDKKLLSKEIEDSKQFINGITEGSNVGQYKPGAKALLQTAIDKATETLNNLIARQTAIDNARQNLTVDVKKCKNSKITEIDRIIASSGAKTGPVTVSLLWNTNDDLDLHVTSPRGDTVYHGNKTSLSDGKLDVDRQVNSFITKPLENIYWSNPPKGTYKVEIIIYTKRSAGNIPCTIRVINGDNINFYNLDLHNRNTIVCTFAY
ncbi:MAG: chitobiase/beta-hexosaminidase C-terminal domain-containing protein [Desulfitobacteriaceae bacterium]|nr:chitobiase/beta-hexosaminidase C-terminal domain-containing protein [Desulfitobacteriaceae bacterium]